MSRNYGLCLWSFGDISFEEKCHLAKKIGVDGVEVQGNLNEDPLYLKSILKEEGLKVLSVTPDNVDISSNNETIRREAVNYFLKLLEWAVVLEAPRICLHGDVGKVRGSGDNDLDWTLLVKSSIEIMGKAEELNLEVVFEVLNRYENHQVITGKEAIKLIKDVGSGKLKVLLDAYHMNIEEPNPLEAIKTSAEYLGVYHVADSNRQAIGNGHADIKNQIKVLHEIGYSGPIIMEMMAEGPNPFSPIKGDDYLEVLIKYYEASLKKMKEWDVIRT